MGRAGSVKLKRAAAAAVCLATGFFLLRNAKAFASGVSIGLELCAGALIPALFPFMALAQFVCISDVSAMMSRPLKPITTGVFNLPPECGGILLMSAIGGYPACARLIGRMAEQGKLTRRTAARMLCFCVNAGPSFLIGAVGAGMIGSVRAGTMLYASQMLSALLIGLALSFTEKRGRWKSPVFAGNEPYSRAFVRSVTDSAQAMISMCAFVVIFCAVLEFLRSEGMISAAGELVGSIVPVESGRIEPFLTGLVEITAGCAATAGSLPLPVLAFLTSFSSLSVIFQISGQLAGSGVPMWSFALSRVVHGAVSSAICLALIRIFPYSAAVLANSGGRLVNSASASGSAALLVMTAFFLLAVGKSRRID